MHFAKYAKKPKSWQEARKIFRMLSLKLHPDKGGDEEVYKKLVAELETWQKHFAEPRLSSAGAADCAGIIMNLKKFDTWLKTNRASMIAFVRVLLSSNFMIILPDQKRNEIFHNHLLILDVVSLWAREWITAYGDVNGARDSIIDLEIKQLPGFLIRAMGECDELNLVATSTNQILKRLLIVLRFQGKEPEMPCPSEKVILS